MGDHVCLSCEKWVPRPYAVSHNRFHQGLTASQQHVGAPVSVSAFAEMLKGKVRLRQPQKPDLATSIVREARAEARRRSSMDPIQPIAPIAPVANQPSAWQRFLRWIGLGN